MPSMIALAGPFGQFAKFQFLIWEVDFHQEVLKDVSANQPVFIRHRPAFHDLHRTVLELQGSNPDRFGGPDVSILRAFVPNASDFGFGELGDPRLFCDMTLHYNPA